MICFSSSAQFANNIAITYGVFNLILIISVLFEKTEYIRQSMAFAIIIDQMYGVVISLYLMDTMPWVHKTYPESAALYLTASMFLIGYRKIQYVILSFTVYFLVKYVYEMRNDLTEEAYSTMAIFACIIMVFFFHAKIKMKE